MATNPASSGGMASAQFAHVMSAAQPGLGVGEEVGTISVVPFDLNNTQASPSSEDAAWAVFACVALVSIVAILFAFLAIASRLRPATNTAAGDDDDEARSSKNPRAEFGGGDARLSSAI